MMMETLSFLDWKIVDPSVPVSSLYLLVPPLQLFSAAMLQVLQQQHMLHYGKLEEFVSLVMEMFPELLSESQRTELTLGLQHMGPAQIGCKTDPALEVLLWELLSRLDQLLQVPDLKQTVSWLHAAPSVLEACLQSVSSIDQLRILLRPHSSCQHLDRNETLPSLEECKLSNMGLPPSQQAVDSAKLIKTNSQSQSKTDCMNCLNPTSSGEDINAESVMDSSDSPVVEPQSSSNRCENVEERTQRKTGNMMSTKQRVILTNMKEEEDGESQLLEMKMEDDESHEEDYRKEKEKQMDKWMEGNSTGQAAQTDELLQNRVNSEHGQQEREESFTLVTSCLLKQPRVLIHKLEKGSKSVNVSSPPRFMVTTLRANGSLRLKGQVLTQKRKTIDQLERPLKLLPSSSDIGMCAEVSLSSPVVYFREQNTGETVEESSPVLASSQCQFVHTEEVNLHQHIEKVHTEELSRTLGSQSSTSNPHQYSTTPETLPTPTQFHICSQCGRSFSLSSELNMHLQTHTGEHPYHCSRCGKSFMWLSDLKEHQRTHTGERPYSCAQCARSFTRLSYLKEHLQTHTREGGFPCSQCGKSFSTLRYVKIHLRTHERPHHCSICGKTFSYPGKLKEHLQTHTNEQPYPCSLCWKSFSTTSNLKQHLQTHANKRPYPCLQCGKSFSSLHCAKRHLQTHTGERPHPCSQCGKSFKRLGHLKDHLQSHTREGGFPCSQCGKSFSTPGYVKMHLRTHERPYHCSICWKTFSFPGLLKKHLQTHTNERPYPCPQCGKTFSSLLCVQNHLQTHTGERPYPCSQCGKSFKRLDHLKGHQRTHTGERPYSCSKCGKRFLELFNLTKHQRTVAKCR